MSDSSGSGSAANGGTRVGVWVDDSPQRVLTDGYESELATLKLDVVAFMVDGNTLPDPKNPQWRPSWTEQELREAADLVARLGAEMILTCWPVPTKDYIHTVCTEMGALIGATNAGGFEVDTEGLWVAKNVAPGDFASLAEAGTYLAASMRQAAPRASLQLTTYPFHAELSKDNTVSRYMDAVVPQAYSTNPGADGKPAEWDGRFGPGRMQQLGVSRAKATKPDANVVCGLAAYGQGFSDHNPADAMRTALDEATALGCSEVRYWSSKWIIGSQRDRTPYAAPFVRGI